MRDRECACVLVRGEIRQPLAERRRVHDAPDVPLLLRLVPLSAELFRLVLLVDRARKIFARGRQQGSIIP